MTGLDSFLNTCDAILIAPFRLPASPEAGFFLGLAVLALGSAGAGRACMALVAWMHRVRRGESDREMARRTELSTLALKAGDKEAYLVQNRLAKDAYGTYAALAAARGAALLWPGAVALGWLSWRFADVPLPFLGDSLGPTTYFLPAYVLAQWLLGRGLGRAGAPH
jgi:hypothetical protein